MKEYSFGERFALGIVSKKPNIIEVLECLRSDAVIIENTPLWSDFASEFGYNEDSIKDYKIYEGCTKQYFELRSLFGEFFKTFVELESE